MHPERPSRSGSQRGLFEPPLERPEWEALPPPARQAAMKFLVQLLEVAAVQIQGDARSTQDNGHE